MSEHLYNFFFFYFYFLLSICGSPWHNVTETWILQDKDRFLVFVNHVHDYGVVCDQCNYLCDKVWEKGYDNYMDTSDQDWYDLLAKEAQELFNTDLRYSIIDIQEMAYWGRQAELAFYASD